MYHEPVLVKEVVELLITEPGGTYVDGTLGGGGHSEAILKQTDTDARLIGIDQDSDALDFAHSRLIDFERRICLQQANFRNIDDALINCETNQVHGILLDLGVSSHQIDTASRGFSFSQDGEIDMRMDARRGQSASNLVNEYAEGELEKIFREFGEERHSRAIARAIVRQRQLSPILTTGQLRELVEKNVPARMSIKSVARIFQALRIAVNDELGNLQTALHACLERLAVGGRLVIITYHSLEDRLVKTFFKSEAASCECPPGLPVCVCDKVSRVKILTRRPISPLDDEMARNPRSRSAKLRAAERIA